MYLKEILLENIGSIDFVDLSLPFNDDGTPQPVVIVGINGSGKSILLSHIADALMEFAKIPYRDVIPAQIDLPSPYFKITGGLNQKISSQYGIALLEFEHNDITYNYVDKTGKCDFTSYSNKIKNRFQNIQSWDLESNYKQIAPQEQKTFEDCFYENVFCYFPPNRHELPHWLNNKVVNKIPLFQDKQRFTGELDKPIFIESCLEKNKSWILDIFLDSLLDFETIQSPNNQTSIQVESDQVNTKQILKQSRINVEKLLQEIFQEPSIKLSVGYRNISYRLSLRKDNKIFIPSLDNLSSGQSILFNLFATIIRYADRADLNNSIQLSQIEGVIIIDEIDAHLHSNLQYEILPKLIKLFPKVQFIVSTHSPLFILGMENEYEISKFQIIEMPQGNSISTERFSEFKKSFEYYKETKSFEDEIEQKIKSANKPKVFTEGETDPEYIKTALELLHRTDILSQIDIEWIGKNLEKGKSINTGDTGLNNARNFLIANPDILNFKVLLIYDCDTNKPSDNHGNLFVRCLKKRDGAKAKKGIENLMPNELFTDDFYSQKEIDKDYGEKNTIQEFQKTKFCQLICKERKNPDDFKYFDQIIEILEEFIDS